MHMACAATLDRDAGAIALILGQVQEARSAFTSAGYLHLQLGFYDGFYLLRLGDSGSEFRHWAPGDALSWLERSLHGGERKWDGLPPFAAAASRSPRQLVSVLQAAGSWNTHLDKAAELASVRLKVYAAYLLGATQTTVESYLNLLKELRVGQLGGGRRTLIGMSVKRVELLSAARRDQFHWRLAQKPADLIDMDLLSIGLTALECKESAFEQARGVAAEFGPMAQVPFNAARLLRAVPPEKNAAAFCPLLAFLNSLIRMRSVGLGRSQNAPVRKRPDRFRPTDATASASSSLTTRMPTKTWLPPSCINHWTR